MLDYFNFNIYFWGEESICIGTRFYDNDNDNNNNESSTNNQINTCIKKRADSTAKLSKSYSKCIEKIRFIYLLPG